MPRASDPRVLLVKWYDPEWLLARIESFPKSQRFVFGQRLADRGHVAMKDPTSSMVDREPDVEQL